MTDWYRIADLPPGRVRVRVTWLGRVFSAARAIKPGTTAWGWFTTRDGEIVPLPPKGQEQRWGKEPDAWQPENPDAWGLPLPKPIRTVAERMVSEKLSFGAVAEAEAAELAREMEADRETARVSRQTDDATHVLPGSQWWWDPTSIKYEPEGAVSERMAEGRIMRALAHADVGKGLTLASKTIGDVLAGIAEAREMALTGGVVDPLARFEPLPQDHADFLIAMRWFVALNPPERRHKRQRAWNLSMPQKVLAWTAQPIPLSSDDMAALVGRSGARMRQVRAEAVAMVHRVANGLPAKASWPVVDHMAALKERNRAYRRQA